MNWLLRVLLWALSIGVWIFSAGFDGRFLRSLMPAGVVGAVMGYGLNFVADVSSEMFAYLFARLQRENSKRTKLWRWSFALLVGQVFALYFGTVFSWAAIAEAAPELARWLQWSAALFAQAVLLFLGIGQALLDVRKESGVKLVMSTPEPAISEPEPVTTEMFACLHQGCGRSFRTQNAVNAHQSAHAGSNGHGLVEEPVQAKGAL